LVAVALDPEPGLAQRCGERLIDGPVGNAAVLGIAGGRIAVGFQRLGVDVASDAVGPEEYVMVAVVAGVPIPLQPLRRLGPA
jgi:hypothetical protein